MTLIRQGTDASLTGMVGGLVICHRNGKTYLRKAPRYTKSSWTPQQKVHRSRFKAANQFCNQFKYTLLRQIWNYVDPRTSGHSLFLKANLEAFSPDGQVMDPLKVKVSTGTLPLEPDMQVSRAEGQINVFQVSWQKGLTGGYHLHDELMVVSKGEKAYSDIYSTGLLRHQKGGTFELPVLPENTTHLHLFFASKDRRDYSESICFEVGANFTN